MDEEQVKNVIKIKIVIVKIGKIDSVNKIRASTADKW